MFWSFEEGAFISMLTNADLTELKSEGSKHIWVILKEELCAKTKFLYFIQFLKILTFYSISTKKKVILLVNLRDVIESISN